MSRRKRDDDDRLLMIMLYLIAENCMAAPTATATARVVEPPQTDFDRMIDKGVSTARAIRKAGEPLRETLYGRSVSPSHAEDLPGPQLTRAGVLAIAKHVGFADPKLASAIAFAESGGVPRAVKRSSKEVSVGLWQINTKVHPYSVDDMRDPIKNARAAFKISKGGTDWRSWTMYTNGKYKQFQTGVFAP